MKISNYQIVIYQLRDSERELSHESDPESPPIDSYDSLSDESSDSD